jgi:hypothetical protein
VATSVPSRSSSAIRANRSAAVIIRGSPCHSMTSTGAALNTVQIAEVLVRRLQRANRVQVDLGVARANRLTGVRYRRPGEREDGRAGKVCP